MSQPITYKTLAQLVVENLRNKIISNEITAGERINLDSLAAEFDVSKNPIREALFVLKGEGLIDFETNKGAIASTLSPDQVNELFTLEALLATNLLSESLPHVSFEKLNEAKELLNHLTPKSSANDCNQLIEAYYLCLYSGVERPQTIEVLTVLATKTARFRHMYLVNSKEKTRIRLSLSLLLDYCYQKEISLAKAHLHHHIMYFREPIKVLCEQF